jgi:transposase InsO family protein
VIESLTGQGINVRHACRTLGVSEAGFYAWRGRPTSPRALRRIFLAGQIVEVHRDSAGIYGAHRITAELRFARQIVVGHNAVASIMRELGIKGLPNRRMPRSARVGKFRCQDLVRRRFARPAPDELWMTDITEHPTREGKIYCCAVIDAFSRYVVGWAVDSTQTTVLVTNALGMATRRRDPEAGLVIHADRGVQFTPWAFSQKVCSAGLAPSIGAVGCPYDNAVVEAFWGRMQVELLNRKSWKTRIELASAIHDYIELFHNARRRHSALGMLTPTEYEERYFQTRDAA